MTYVGGIKILNKPFAYRAEYDADNNVVREGWAMPGTPTSVAQWQICEHTWSGGNLVSTKWPSGSGEFSFEWDERKTGLYTYS